MGPSFQSRSLPATQFTTAATTSSEGTIPARAHTALTAERFTAPLPSMSRTGAPLLLSG